MNRVVTAAGTDGFAVYETPWNTVASASVIPTEVDLFELVQPPGVTNNIWNVYAEASRVDVLLHHRDTRALSSNDAYVGLFFRELASNAALLAELASTFTPLHAWQGGAIPAVTNWTSAGKQQLAAPLDAFMPKAVSFDVNLSAVATGNHVLFLAVCGSTVEAPPAPAGLTGTSTIGDLVRAWPRSALRLVQVVGPRPV